MAVGPSRFVGKGISALNQLVVRGMWAEVTLTVAGSDRVPAVADIRSGGTPRPMEGRWLPMSIAPDGVEEVLLLVRLIECRQSRTAGKCSLLSLGAPAAHYRNACPS